MATNNAGDIATGATGTVLQGQGVGSRPAFSTFSGNRVLIDTKTANNSATIEFETGITGYDIYYMIITNALPATNGAHLTMQYSTDGGSNYSATGYANIQGFATTSAGGGFAQGTTYATLVLGQSNASSTLVANGECFLFDFGSANQKTFRCNIQANNASGYLPQYNTGYWTTTTAVNAFQILYSAGNITQGTFKLYGIVN